jgi:hypothetical protein
VGRSLVVFAISIPSFPDLLAITDPRSVYRVDLWVLACRRRTCALSQGCDVVPGGCSASASDTYRVIYLIDDARTVTVMSNRRALGAYRT